MRLGQRKQVVREVCARYGVQYAVYCVLYTMYWLLRVVLCAQGGKTGLARVGDRRRRQRGRREWWRCTAGDTSCACVLLGSGGRWPGEYVRGTVYSMQCTVYCTLCTGY